MQLNVEKLGPIRDAKVRFGDLTVFVGPQATGKSIFLETFKLLLDAHAIHQTMRHYNLDWESDPASFFELYYGDGMADIWSDASRVSFDGRKIDLSKYARPGNRTKGERLFFIPAQRVMTLRDGQTRPFTDYRSGDPFVVRDFSEKVHNLIQSELATGDKLFPQANRLNEPLRRPLMEAIFGGSSLKVAAEKFQRRLVLETPTGEGRPLSYLVWSAGQREFVPLLLGLYWLLPPAATPRRGETQWVVIEELEMGLHPSAISAVMALVFELLARGYKVCLSTHSPHVLDVVWGVRFLQANGGTQKEVRDIFRLGASAATNRLADEALRDDKEYRTYFFQRDGVVRDISTLDPGSEKAGEAGWGGLTEFSGHIGDIVAKVARRAEK